MMSRSFTLLVLGALFTAARSCDDIDNYFGMLGSVTEIDLGAVTTVDCPANDEGGDLDEILVASGTSLTIKSTQSYVRFVNVKFTVEEGATLVFDMPATWFGPNSGDEEGGTGFMLDVYDDASVTFKGEFSASEIRNIRSVFHNTAKGTIDFKGDALFNDNGNVFRSNYGTLKFRGHTVFKNNIWLALDLMGPSSYVRFSKTATFDDNGGSFDGATGCGVANREGTVIFRDDALFMNHKCDEGPAVFNGGKMKFYGKARFNDNQNQNDWGGGVANSDGTLLFKSAVQFNRNEAETGGGMAVTGGKVTFKKAVKFDGNGAESTGGAFSVSQGGQYGTSEESGFLEFKKPQVVRYENNVILKNEFNDQLVTGCTLAYVEDGTTLEGFDVEDVCVEDTV